MSAAAKHNDVLGGYSVVSYRLFVESIYYPVLTTLIIQNRLLNLDMHKSFKTTY